jgi:RHS repeat-associated protein
MTEEICRRSLRFPAGSISKRDVYETRPKTDCSAAIAEIDAAGNIFELHCDHLGSPRHITSGATGQVAGEQAFGPYGERMVGTFSGKVFPSGYRPVTGWTGHIDEDPTGLVYMRGRYYSPLWHRFVSSDRGMDPNSLNQYAYVGGSPFTAVDPSGMEMWCFTVAVIVGLNGGPPVQTGEFELHADVDVVWGEMEVCLTIPGGDYGGGGGSPGFGGGGSEGGPSGEPKGPSAPTAQKCGDGRGILDLLISAANTVWYGRSDEVALHSQTNPYAKVLYSSVSVGLKETGISGGIATATAPLGGPGSPWVFRAVGPEASARLGLGMFDIGYGITLPGANVGGSIFKAQFGYQMADGTLYFGLDVGAGFKVKSGAMGGSCIFGVSFEN